MNEIDLLKKKGFSGAVKLTYDSKDLFGILFFDSGEIKLIFLEDAKKGEKETEIYDVMNGEGLLEIYRFTHEQMEEIYKLIGEDKVKPYSVKQIENILEAYKLIKEYGTAMELPAEEKIPRRAIKTYSVKEIEKLLKGRVSSSEFEDVRCRKIFEKIKGDLERYFGPQLADKLLDIQFKKLGIGKEITCRDVGMIMADLESGILEKILGKERSEVAIERFKEYFNVYALE